MTRKDAPPGIATVQIDNARVRVTCGSLRQDRPLVSTRTPHNYCVVPLVSGKLRLEEDGTTREMALTVGQSYYPEAGIAHDVINANPHDFAFVEIELK